MVKFARLKTTYHFDAAHHLPEYDGKCREKHGHRWELDVIIEGRIDDQTGFVLDFKIVKDKVNARVIEKLDHKDLNDLISNPTAENICDYIWTLLDGHVHFKLIEIRLRETPECEVRYKGGVN